MWTVVAMLGVLKAGGAFALFDVSQPERRLLEVIEHRELCSHTKRPVLVVGPGLQKLDSDPTWPIPKGIVITHSAFCSAHQHQSDAFGFHPDARVFDFAAYSFDVSVYNAMMTLAIGACLCIPSEEQRKGKLNQTLRDMGVTIAALTPSASRLLEPEKLPDLQTLILSGEAVSASDLARLKRGNFHVLNAYGPAECTPMSTLNANAITPGISVDIGKGIGALTWVVDPSDYKNLVPMGTTGELLLEGPILAEGYLGEPEKTEAAFITDPPWLLQGAPSWPGRRGRLYKTGDLVRYDAEGNLDFIGRKDGQVKLHGQRLELGEVEHHVRRHMPQGGHIVANVIELGGQKERQVLAVFLTGQGGWSDPKRVTEDLELVRVHRNIEVVLKQSLPSYMVPALYFRVSVMPLSATGKVDRRRLCEMGAVLSAQRLVELRGSSTGKHEPKTDTETLLRDLWAEALGVEVHSISTDDDFFLLGGDSIAAIKLVGAAGSAGIALSVAAVFRCPTIEAQAQTQVDTVARKAETLSPFSLLGGTEGSQTTRKVLAGLCNLADASLIDDAYPCTPLQEGMISLATKRAGDYVLQAVLELHENVQLHSFKAAWDEIFRTTGMLRTRIATPYRVLPSSVIHTSHVGSYGLSTTLCTMGGRFN
ncbi:acetyl-CoA synthetase-like protein [Xylaria curta]|nr:acetyl-CoA synthetase-like protein [Xylaria curta]